jgi:hypothetical protein
MSARILGGKLFGESASRSETLTGSLSYQRYWNLDEHICQACSMQGKRSQQLNLHVMEPGRSRRSTRRSTRYLSYAVTEGMDRKMCLQEIKSCRSREDIVAKANLLFTLARSPKLQNCSRTD